MRCPVCGWRDAGSYHIAGHEYAQRLRGGIYAVTRAEGDDGPRFFLGEKECAVIVGWCIWNNKIVLKKGDQIIYPPLTETS